VEDIVEMKKIIYWLKKYRRLEKRRCGGCCLICRYYKECVKDGDI